VLHPSMVLGATPSVTRVGSGVTVAIWHLRAPPPSTKLNLPHKSETRGKMGQKLGKKTMGCEPVPSLPW